MTNSNQPSSKGLAYTVQHLKDILAIDFMEDDYEYLKQVIIKQMTEIEAEWSTEDPIDDAVWESALVDLALEKYFDGHRHPRPLNPNEYRCENCLEVYERDRPDTETQAEYEANFPNAARQKVPQAIVCDDCYKEMIAWKDPKEADREYGANK